MVHPRSDRRIFMSLAVAGALAWQSLTACAEPPPQEPVRKAPTEELLALEAKSQGRLGVGILDTATGELVGHRQD